MIYKTNKLYILEIQIKIKYKKFKARLQLKKVFKLLKKVFIYKFMNIKILTMSI